VHARGGGRVPLGEKRVGALRAELVVGRLPALTLARCRRRRQLEVGQRRAQIEAGAADDDGGPTCGDDLVDRRMRKPLEAPDRDLLGQRDDPDEPGGILGRRRQDRDAGKERSGVGRDDLRVDALQEDPGDRRLAARGRPVDREDLRQRRPAA
jgi:hypothetical protein